MSRYLNRRRFMAAAEQIDATEPEVIALLHQLAHEMRVKIDVLHSGRPLDLLIGLAGVTISAEVKQPEGPRGGSSKTGQKLNDNQREHFESWPGAPPLLLTVNDCQAKVHAEVERQLGRTVRRHPTGDGVRSRPLA